MLEKGIASVSYYMRAGGTGSDARESEASVRSRRGLRRPACEPVLGRNAFLPPLGAVRAVTFQKLVPNK